MTRAVLFARLSVICLALGDTLASQSSLSQLAIPVAPEGRKPRVRSKAQKILYRKNFHPAFVL